MGDRVLHGDLLYFCIEVVVGIVVVTNVTSLQNVFVENIECFHFRVFTGGFFSSNLHTRSLGLFRRQFNSPISLKPLNGF